MDFALAVFFFCASLTGLLGHVSARSFKIGKNCFLKDGEPYRYVSGTMHYWRVPPEYWEDTFIKMQAAGLTAVDTYLIWNLHEQEPGEYTFDGILNFTRYFELAQKTGLLVVLRPGPFIAAETDLGGLPYWLIRKDPNIHLRTMDSSYLYFVERWYNVSLPLVRKYLYVNGGPIITVQVENEYGAYGCDVKYLSYLRDLLRNLLGNDTVLFTNNYPDGDPPHYLECGSCPDTLTGGDFGPPSVSGKNVSYYLDNLRKVNPDGPLVDAEFYDGWLDVWGSPHSHVPVEEVLESAQVFIDRNVSFNFYTFHGGTSFGFVPCYGVTTSYDFDSALSEAGDPTDKYYKIRDFLGKYFPLPPGPPPKPSPKAAYGTLQMAYSGTVYENLDTLCPGGPIFAVLPMSFEALKHANGFVLYRTKIVNQFRDPAVLSVPGLRDRAIVLIDQEPVGILGREVEVLSTAITIRPGQTLDLLVQNEGRNGFFYGGDMKGMTFTDENVFVNATLDKHDLIGWTMYPLKLPHYPIPAPVPIGIRPRKPRKSMSFGSPAFYSGTLNVTTSLDTFIELDGWTHGYIFINGYNLGRYWPVQGPQVTLYVPGVYLSQNAPNVVEIFELERAPCARDAMCNVRFVDTPVINGTVPNGSKQRQTFRQAGRLNRQRIRTTESLINL